MPKLQQLSRRRLIDSTFSGDEVGSVLMFILEVLLFEAGSRCAVAVLVECVSCLPNAKSRDLAGTLMRLFAPETFIGTSLIVSRSQSIHVSEKTCIQSSRVVPLQSRSTRPVVFLESLSSRRRLLSSARSLLPCNLKLERKASWSHVDCFRWCSIASMTGAKPFVEAKDDFDNRILQSFMYA